MATPIELLAPAKDLACGMAAIDHGADAVYVGAPAFSARASAGNSLQDIEQLCNYAHRYHAFVHVALNTILTDSELETARKIIYRLYEAGADALIIQDTGILQLDLPPIAIHASTQTDNRSPEKVAFWETIGLQRVILARELSLEQIREIRHHTTIPLESFVHGALCVCYSGQCYMSEACLHRSANRGNCAQFCRLPYSLSDANGNSIKENSHLLSLKDMNRSNSLIDLMEAGITSLKIEGRLKGLDYVKNITAFYRQKLDAIFEKDQRFTRASSGIVKTTFNPNPEKTFNRGWTEYFLRHRENVMVEPDTPKSIGENIGKVLEIKGNNIRIKTNLQLHNGDGLGFVNEHNELQGFRINRADGEWVTTLESIPTLQIGTQIYRNYDLEFDKLLQGPSATRQISVDITLYETEKGIALTMSDTDQVTVTLDFEIEKEISHKGEAANVMIAQNLAKLGGTMFRAGKVSVETSKPYFFPASVVNEWRRKAVNALIQKRLERHPRPQRTLARPNTNTPFPLYTPARADYRANIMNQKADNFYRQHGATETQPAFEKLPTDKATLMTCKHCIRFTLGFCTKNKKIPPLLEPLYLQTGNFRFELSFDCKNCEMNVVRANE